MEMEARRGERARQLLKDPLISEALNSMRENVFTNIRTSHYKDIDDREDLYKMLKVIDQFEGQFNKLIRDGKVARSKLAELKKAVKSAINWR